ncbi:MAG: DUF2029 domain-containing protein [Thaumarchaeota archaeon]|nr:DUF2029 domain-containing protein [Nitrososphaerota archaeon]
MSGKESLFASLGAIVSGLLLSFVVHNPISVPNIYSDIGSFWYRGWVGSGGLPYVSEVFEYPPVSGFLLYFARIVGGSQTGYYEVFSAMSLAAGVVLAATCWRTAKLRGTQLRSWYFIMPSVIVYGIYNFDLFHAMFVMISLYALLSGRRSSSAIALGLAVSTKLASGVLLPVYLLEIRDWRNSAKFAAVFGGLLGVLNLPLVLANYSNWLGTYAYISNWGLEDAWFVWIFQDPSTWPVAKLFGFGLMGVLLLRVYTLRMDPVTKSFLALSAYLLGTYIYTPQFNLVLIPLVAVLSVEHPSLYLWDTFNALIILTWFIYPDPTLAWTIPQTMALLRAVMLLWLAVWVLNKAGWRVGSLIPFRSQKTLDGGVEVPGLSSTFSGE